VHDNFKSYLGVDLLLLIRESLFIHVCIEEQAFIFVKVKVLPSAELEACKGTRFWA
jgi:hypothetical protein